MKQDTKELVKFQMKNIRFFIRYRKEENNEVEYVVLGKRLKEKVMKVDTNNHNE